MGALGWRRAVSGTVLMIVHAYYDEDPRVRREAETLMGSGWRVRVIGLRRPGDPRYGTLAGVRVTRLDVQRHQGAGILTYLREYLSFGMRAAWEAIAIRRRERIVLVQVHSLPDFLAFAALPLRIIGVPLVLDLHEAMPVFFASRFPRAASPIVRWMLVAQERLSIWLSSATISVNQAMRDRLMALGIRPDKVTVVPNAPSIRRFDRSAHPVRPFAEDGVVRLIYAGALTPTYELGVAVEALALLARDRPTEKVELAIYGRGDSEAALAELAESLGVRDRVRFYGRIPIDSVAAALAGADIGLAPTRRDDFTELSLSGKVFEYAAMGKPVVASRLPMVEAAFPPDAITLYEPADPASMAAAITSLIDDATRREEQANRALDVARATSWERESTAYIDLIDRLAFANETTELGLARDR